MQSARGSVLLFADADGATKFSDLDKLDNSMKDILGCKCIWISSFYLKYLLLTNCFIPLFFLLSFFFSRLLGIPGKSRQSTSRSLRFPSAFRGRRNSETFVLSPLSHARLPLFGLGTLRTEYSRYTVRFQIGNARIGENAVSGVARRTLGFRRGNVVHCTNIKYSCDGDSS